MARTRSREAQLILGSVTLFTLIWFTLFLHPSTYFLFTSVTHHPSDLSDEPLANILLNLDLDDTNHFLPPLITPDDQNRKILPAYVAAAAGFGDETVKFAVVDSTAEVELAANYSALSYLTIYLFVDGDMREFYDYPRRANEDDIVSWVKLQIHGNVHYLMNKEEAMSILADNSTSTNVLGILDSLEGRDSKELLAAAKLQTESTIYMTNMAEVANVFNINPKIKRPALVIVEKKTKSCIRFDGQFTRWAMATFVSVTLPLVAEFTEENAQFILDSPRDQLLLFALRNYAEVVLPSFREAAKSLRGELLFVYVEMDNGFDAVRKLSGFIGINRNEPAVVAYSPVNSAKEVLHTGFTSSSIKAFAQDFLKRSLQAS